MLTLSPVILAIAIAAPTTEPHWAAVEGTWDAHFRPSLVQLNVRLERERLVNFGATYSVDDLSELRRDKRAIGFELRRDAGTFRFYGVSKDLRANGTFSFTPNTNFKRSIEKLGFRSVDKQQQMTLALNNVTVDDLKVLKRSVKGKLGTPELIRMLENGATPHFVRDLSGVGFARLTPQALINIRKGGVDADYIRGLRASGLILSLDEYMKARDAGLTIAYVQDLREVGLRDLCLSEYIKLREHDVTAEFATAVIQSGHDSVDLDDLVRLRTRAVTPTFAKTVSLPATF